MISLMEMEQKKTPLNMKMRISRILTYSLTSCKSKHHTNDVVETRQKYQLIDLFSPKHPPFSQNMNKTFIPHLPSDDHHHNLDGRKCPPASPANTIHSPLNNMNFYNEFMIKPSTTNPKKKHTKKKKIKSSSCSNFVVDQEEDENASLVSYDTERDVCATCRTRRRPRRRAREDVVSLAVVKRSSDPYSDFRMSMVEMIVEKQIFGVRELEKLLESFLSLNSYHHHNLIIQVFSELYEAFFCH